LSTFSIVSILVLLDSWAKTFIFENGLRDLHLFQSLFCWIHGLRLVITHNGGINNDVVSILVLLDSWAKTAANGVLGWKGCPVSILVLLDSWAKTG